jgi:hypothetical protein
MSDEQTNAESDTPRRRIAQLFSTELGRQVMHDLLRQEEIYSLQFREDPRVQAFEEGRKSLVLEFLSSVATLQGQDSIQTFYSYALEDF